MTLLEEIADCTTTNSMTQGYKEGVERALQELPGTKKLMGINAKKLMGISNMQKANKLMGLASQLALPGTIITMHIPLTTDPQPNVTR